jgi:peptide/nickel transport system permease protein
MSINRILLMIPTLIAISIIVFGIIQLPPGNYLESYIAELQAQGESVDPQKIAFLKQEYGLDKPIPEQYLRWAAGMLKGDFGYSFEFNMPVTKVVGDRMFLTIIVSAFTILFTWAVAFPIGIYSATHQYSWGDYGLSLLGFLGSPSQLHAGARDAVPRQRGVRNDDRRADGSELHRQAVVVGEDQVDSRAQLDSGVHHRRGRHGGHDPQDAREPSGRAAEAIRGHGRAKGLPPGKVLRKYPLRMALNFFISDIGSLLPHIISGAEITAVVLSLPTTGRCCCRRSRARTCTSRGRSSCSLRS